MADVQDKVPTANERSPGWWQASDGEWYPPTRKPEVDVSNGHPGPSPAPLGPHWQLSADDGYWYPGTDKTDKSDNTDNTDGVEPEEPDRASDHEAPAPGADHRKARPHEVDRTEADIAPPIASLPELTNVETTSGRRSGFVARPTPTVPRSVEPEEPEEGPALGLVTDIPSVEVGEDSGPEEPTDIDPHQLSDDLELPPFAGLAAASTEVDEPTITVEAEGVQLGDLAPTEGYQPYRPDTDLSDTADSDLADIYVSDTDLADTDPTDTDPTDTELAAPSLNNTNLADVYVSDTELSETELSDVDRAGTDVTKHTVIDADRDPDFTDIDFSNTDLSGNGAALDGPVAAGPVTTPGNGEASGSPQRLEDQPTLEGSDRRELLAAWDEGGGKRDHRPSNRTNGAGSDPWPEITADPPPHDLTGDDTDTTPEAELDASRWPLLLMAAAIIGALTIIIWLIVENTINDSESTSSTAEATEEVAPPGGVGDAYADGSTARLADPADATVVEFANQFDSPVGPLEGEGTSGYVGLGRPGRLGDWSVWVYGTNAVTVTPGGPAGNSVVTVGLVAARETDSAADLSDIEWSLFYVPGATKYALDDHGCSGDVANSPASIGEVGAGQGRTVLLCWAIPGGSANYDDLALVARLTAPEGSMSRGFDLSETPYEDTPTP